MAITRRIFMHRGALALASTAAVPAFLTRAMWASDEALAGNKRLVVIFMRGAADGLNIVVPHGEASYYSMRPTIAIPRNSVIDLDGFFGLHPSLSALKPLWDQKHLAFVHAAGSPDPTRSHFDAQDYMESGTPGRKSTPDGWLNRSLRDAAASGKPSPFRAVSMGGHLPRILSGGVAAVAMGDIDQFGVGARNPAAAPMANTFEAMYAQSADTVLHGTGKETFDAVKMLRSAKRANYVPDAAYPRGPLGNSLSQLAQLIKLNLGVQVAFADVEGWDHHVNEGSVQGQLGVRLADLAGSISAFWKDLGDLASETVVVTMSEFGRTARENGSRGTDHGHANVMMVLGGPVRGGKVYGRWPGLSPEHLNDGRDLALTTDFRTVLGEMIREHLATRDLAAVFPGFANDERSFLRLLR